MKRTVKSVVAVLLAGAASFGEAGTLPEGYLPVKCLISNGSQVIDTGVPPGPTTRMTMDFELTQIPTANMYCGRPGRSRPSPQRLPRRKRTARRPRSACSPVCTSRRRR